jgi:glycosyltransferase involved in cell wall biosynthesis
MVVNISRGLAESLGNTVAILLFEDANEFKEELKGIQVIVCPSEVRYSLSGKGVVQLEAFQKVIQTFQPDVIHSHLMDAELVTRENNLPGIRYITHVHNNIPEFRKVSLLRKPFKQNVIQHFVRNRIMSKYKMCNNQFIAISKMTEEYLRQNLDDTLKNSIHLLPNAVRCSDFSYDGQRDLSSIRMVSTGTVDRNKNHIFLVHVVEELRRRGKDASLTILGDGPEMQNLKQYIADNNLESYIFLKGKITDIRPCLEAANVYVHSAISEAFGLAIVEGMASGLPVVSIDGGGNRGLITDGLNGYILPREQIVTFCDKVVLIIEEGKYNTYSVNAKNTALEFDFKAYLFHLQNIYKNKPK